MYDFLKAHWVAGAALMALLQLLLVPLLAPVWPTGLLLVFLHSPAYMIHQVEEHRGDRFRRYINRRVLGGREGLTTADVLWINVGGVWGLDLVALYAAAFAGLGWGLAAPYLMLVNALSHIGTAVRFRGYNPGLATSIFLFLPLGAATLWIVPASVTQHLIGLVIALLVHGAIVLNLLRRLRTAPVALA